MPDKRLIESAFPLKETSLDAVHEKNIRHGHLSTLHIWPARRPLAAARAALIATLLPEPLKPEDRKALVKQIGGELTTVVKMGKEREVTKGGVLHWKREKSPKLAELREQIHTHYGRAPVVMDPFAGGGAIPLEAMRLGCKTIAADINPVAWFLLKCTLDYPQRLSGEKRPLPDFAVASDDFLSTYLKKTIKSLSGRRLEQKMREARDGLFPLPDLGFAWHVRAWGQWVLDQARADLELFYPAVNGQQTVAYLWARTVPCKSCGATLPLLKTRWLLRRNKTGNRVLLTMKPNEDKTGVVYGIRENVPKEGSGATLREHDKKLGAGTMSRAGATCPCCTHTMTMEELRDAITADPASVTMTAVITEGEKTRSFRLPTDAEREAAEGAAEHLDALFAEIPFGLPDDPLPSKDVPGIRVPLYGITKWSQLFTPRQLLSLGTFVKYIRHVHKEMRSLGYGADWAEAVMAYLALALDRMADRSSVLCRWDVGEITIANVFSGFKLPIVWDFVESVPFSGSTGSFQSQLDWIARYAAHGVRATKPAPPPEVLRRSALVTNGIKPDVILTDPPYYDAIPYAALMDFFHVWLRRTTHGLSPEIDAAFEESLGPKWDHEAGDGELIDDSSRFGGDATASKQAYEDGMARAFKSCYDTLADDGRLVIVFAHKKADAWETLVSAIIRSGFTVTASWPIQTEMGNRTRAQSSAALSSSIWLVCRKRPASARPGWDTQVLAGMRQNIADQLRRFWDAGIRGADFLWAATGPALEAYSAHPYVKKTNSPGEILSVEEFLNAAGRMVLEFAVSDLMDELADGSTGDDAVRLDNITRYYLLHRSEYGLKDVPVGASILYAVRLGLSDTELADRYDLIRSGKARTIQEEVEDEEEGTGSGSDGNVRLKSWKQRGRKTLGHEVPGGRAVPLIDKVHRLLHLYNAGDVAAVDEYVRQHGLADMPLFERLIRALSQLAKKDNQAQEQSLLDAMGAHLKARAHATSAPAPPPAALTLFE